MKLIGLPNRRASHGSDWVAGLVLGYCVLTVPNVGLAQGLSNDSVAQNPLQGPPSLPPPAPQPEVAVAVPAVPVVSLPAGLVLQDCPHCPQLVVLPPGDFIMGSNEAYDDEKPRHRVTIKSFAIGKHEVTQGQWSALMGSNPSKFVACGDDCPVEQVSAHDVAQYLKKLNASTGQNYRLPSEAEWEYAARAGASGKWSVGNDATLLDAVAWYRPNSGFQTQPVGQKEANAFGLHDLHGNVWEWVQDAYHDTYQGAPNDGSVWLGGATQVLRGGSWIDFPGYLRSAMRVRLAPELAYDRIGFRVAKSLP